MIAFFRMCFVFTSSNILEVFVRQLNFAIVNSKVIQLANGITTLFESLFRDDKFQL